MKLKLCTYPGCETLVADGSSRCPEHKVKPNGFSGQRTKSRQWHSLYQSARWRNERKDFLKSHPYCYVCGAPAKIVDHIRPHRGDIDLFYDESNWQPMCWQCHSRKTLKENNFFHGEGGGKNITGKRL